MSTRDFVVLTDVSLITCVVQRGKAEQVVKAAQDADAKELLYITVAAAELESAWAY